MAKYKDYIIDNESAEIANKLQMEFEENFDHIDLSKVCFIREKNKKSGKNVAKTTAIKYPADIDSSYIYYITINDNMWNTLEEAQKVLTIFSQLCSIEIDGTDEQSVGYAKIRKPEIVEFAEVLKVTNGEYDWINNPVKNILE